MFFNGLVIFIKGNLNVVDSNMNVGIATENTLESPLETHGAHLVRLRVDAVVRRIEPARVLAPGVPIGLQRAPRKSAPLVRVP